MITNAARGDAEKLAQIAAQNNFSAHWSAEDFAKEIAQPHALVLTAQDSGAISGFISYRFVPPAAELTNFAVADGAQRKGVGAELLTQSLQILKRRGVNEITLEVSERNAAAAALYAKHGFKQINIRKKFYNNTDDALLLKAVI